MSGLGESLKSIREEKQVSLEDIAQRTRISLKILSDLEKEEFQSLPGDFYVKGIIKNYLNALGEDSREFLNNHRVDIQSFSGVGTGAETASKYIPRIRYSRFKKKSFFFTFVSILLLIILILIFAYINKQSLANLWEQFFGKVKLPETGVCFQGFDCQFSLDRSPVQVSLYFKDDCWTQFKRGGGEVLEKTYLKGDRVDMRGYELSLYIGNPAAVQVVLNGKELSYLKNLSSPRRLEINPRTVDGFLNRL